MMSAKNLIPIEKVNAVELFTQDGNLDALLITIEEQVASIVPDIHTAAGRKDIASTAYKIARSKTAIDAAGKELVGGWKRQAKEVDGARKHARDFLDSLRDQVRQPLTEWERAEGRRKAAEKLREMIEAAHEQALVDNDLWNRERELQRREAAIRQQEQEARLKAEAEERERQQKERDEKIRLEAEEKAKREAAEALERERQRADQAEREAKEATERAEQERLDSLERERLKAEEAERARIEAEKRAAREKKERDRQQAEQLTAMLARVTGGHDDWSNEHTWVLVTIGKGMFWSADLHEKAKALAVEINEEFERHMVEGHGRVAAGGRG